MEQGFLIIVIIFQIGLGTYILVRDPRAKTNQFLAWCAFSYTLGTFAGLLRSLAIEPSAAAHLILLSTIVVYVWSGTFVGMCVLAIFYPQQFERHRFWTMVVPLALAVLATIVALVFFVRLPDKTEIVTPLAGTDRYGVNYRAFSVHGWGIAYLSVWSIISLVLLIHVAVHRPGNDRQSAVLLAVLVLLPGALGAISSQVLPAMFALTGPTLGSVVLFMAFVYVIIRYRLFSAEEVAVGLVLDNLSDGMLIVRHDHIVLDCNARAAEMLGQSQQEIVRMRMDHVLAHSSLPADVWNDLWLKLEQGCGPIGETRYGEGQSERVLSGQVMPIHDTSHDLRGYVWLIRDVTELWRNQEQNEARNRDLQMAIEELQDTSEVQSQLLETIRTLSAPAVPVLEGIIVMPLSGQIDSERAQRILDNLLEGIEDHQAKIAIMDITGVPVVDTAVAMYLIQTARAASLMGCRSLLVGIRPEIAQVIVELGIDMSGLATFGDLQSGIEYALRRQGIELVRSDGARGHVIVR
jgi:PAS domain S-box-containing protein